MLFLNKKATNHRHRTTHLTQIKIDANHRKTSAELIFNTSRNKLKKLQIELHFKNYIFVPLEIATKNVTRAKKRGEIPIF
jgi:hypothetical protein